MHICAICSRDGVDRPDRARKPGRRTDPACVRPSAPAQIIAAISDFSPGMSFLIATGVTVAYTALGGFLAVENTDRFQALLLLGGITFRNNFV